MAEKCKAGAKVIVIACFSLSLPLIRPNYDCAKGKWQEGKKKVMRACARVRVAEVITQLLLQTWLILWICHD